MLTVLYLNRTHHCTYINNGLAGTSLVFVVVVVLTAFISLCSHLHYIVILNFATISIKKKFSIASRPLASSPQSSVDTQPLACPSYIHSPHLFLSWSSYCRFKSLCIFRVPSRYAFLTLVFTTHSLTVYYVVPSL